MHISEVPALVRHLPYVKESFYMEDRRWCEGWLKSYPGQKPRKCKRAAQWHFKRSSTNTKGRAKSQWVCTYHLVVNCLEYSIYEQARVKRALKKAGVDIAKQD